MAENDEAESTPRASVSSGAETPAVEASVSAAASVEPPKKRKLKKTKAAAAGASGDEASKLEPALARGAEDDGQFGATKVLASLPGAGTPEGDTLRDAWAAFEVGDYRGARELAARISRSEDRAIAAAAEDVLRRTGVDQVQVAFLVACALAILTIAWIYIPH